MIDLTYMFKSFRRYLCFNLSLPSLPHSQYGSDTSFIPSIEGTCLLFKTVLASGDLPLPIKCDGPSTSIPMVFPFTSTICVYAIAAVHENFFFWFQSNELLHRLASLRLSDLRDGGVVASTRKFSWQASIWIFLCLPQMPSVELKEIFNPESTFFFSTHALMKWSLKRVDASKLAMHMPTQCGKMLIHVAAK